MAAVSFKADGTGRRQFQCLFEHLPIACTMRHVVPHGNDHFIPILRLIVLKVFVRSRQNVIAALKLWLADEDAARFLENLFMNGLKSRG